MTQKETTAIAVKCFAIYILAQVIISLPTLAALGLKIGSYGQHDIPRSWILVISVSSLALGLVTAYLLWKFTNSLLTKEPVQETATGDLEAEGIMKIVLACMGVYFIIDAAMTFPHAIVQYHISRSNPAFQAELSAMYLLAQVLELTFGGLLIAKPNKWVKMIRSLGK